MVYEDISSECVFAMCFSEHTIQQLKVLEQVIGGLKRTKEAQDVHCRIFNWWIKAALKLIWANGIDIKVHRKIIRVRL